MTGTALLVTTAATAFDALVAGAILFARPGDPIGWRRVTTAILAVAGLGFVKCLAALGWAHSYFLVVALVYADVLVLVPVMGVALLLCARRRRVSRFVRVVSWLSLLLVPVFVVGTFVEPFRLVTEHVDVPIAPGRDLSRPLVIGVLADIQCVEVTAREHAAVARVMAAKPDLVLIPGDIQQAGFADIERMGTELHGLFAPLSAPLGVWYVEGNTESTGEARRLLAGTSVRILDDEIVRLEHGGSSVSLCGVDLMFQSPRARDVLREIEAQPEARDVRIVLAHRPDVIKALSPHTRVDLVVSGHTHGGQVQLPWFGPPITLSAVPRRVAAGGLHEVDGRRVYVSRGIGWEHGHAPRVRFLCAPEVTILRLVR